MGAWGEKPDENDSAMDLVYRVVQPMRRAVSKLFPLRGAGANPRDPWRRWERVGVVYHLTKMSPTLVDYDDVRAAMADLDALSDDEEFISEWKSPPAFRRSLSQTLKYFKKLKAEY